MLRSITGADSDTPGVTGVVWEKVWNPAACSARMVRAEGSAEAPVKRTG
jgi:hypothetical protein